MKKFNNRKRRLVFNSTLTGAGILLFVFLITSTWIGLDVKQQCLQARMKYDGKDCVEVLTAKLEDENNSYRERNSAIWALGQLGEQRALSVLEKYYTGTIPEREPYNEAISQYELKKAIDLAQGAFNATAFIWRDDADSN